MSERSEYFFQSLDMHLRNGSLPEVALRAAMLDYAEVFGQNDKPQEGLERYMMHDGEMITIKKDIPYMIHECCECGCRHSVTWQDNGEYVNLVILKCD